MDSSDDSIQTRVLKKSRRRIIYSSSSDEEGLVRQEECLQASDGDTSTPRTDQKSMVKDGSARKKTKSPSHTSTKRSSSSQTETKQGQKPSATPCVHATREPVPSTSRDRGSVKPSGTPPGGVIIQEDEVIITLSHEDTSPWSSCSSDEGTESDSSTPAYKRGKRDVKEGDQESLDAIARRLIQKEGMKVKRAPRWMRKFRAPTTVILCDSFLQQWPPHDGKMVVIMNTENDLWRWNAVIRSQQIGIQYINVVVCLRKLARVDGVTPLKNAIQCLSRSIRTVNPDCRIFFTNLPPNPQGVTPVLGKRIPIINLEIQQAIEMVCRQGFIKLHFLSVYEHLVDARGRVITPVQKYFRHEQEFTTAGCALFREIIMREAGMKTYWFDRADSHAARRDS